MAQAHLPLQLLSDDSILPRQMVKPPTLYRSVAFGCFLSQLSEKLLANVKGPHRMLAP